MFKKACLYTKVTCLTTPKRNEIKSKRFIAGNTDVYYFYMRYGTAGNICSKSGAARLGSYLHRREQPNYTNIQLSYNVLSLWWVR